MLEPVPSFSDKSETKVKCSFISHFLKIKEECFTVDRGETVVNPTVLLWAFEPVQESGFLLQHLAAAWGVAQKATPKRQKSYQNILKCKMTYMRGVSN